MSEQTGCREVLAVLSEYLNLELPCESFARIEEHLAQCPKCIGLARSLRETVDLCRQYKPNALPENLNRRAREQLQEAWRKMLSSREQHDGHDPSRPR